MQPILPAATTSGRSDLIFASLAVAQLAGNLGLEDVVDAGRAAAEMAFGHVEHGESRLSSGALSAGCVMRWPCCSEQAA